MRIIDTLDLTAPPPGTVLGNHAVYLPALAVKLPWQFGGRLIKRTRPAEPTYPLDSIVDEIQILRALAAERMAPPVGDVVFVRNIISDFPGAWWCDPVGAYGYEIADARTLPPGRFDMGAMRAMWGQQPDGGYGFEMQTAASRLPPTPFAGLPVEGSPGAWSDITVPGRDNVVNGYLVDVRRTAWDMLRWRGERFELPEGGESPDALRGQVHRECQFPPGARDLAYQDFCLAGQWERGQRRVIDRAHAFGWHPKEGESVLDIGCQSGGFLQYAWAHGARHLVGVDIEPRYIDCARALARSCYFGQNINFRCMDVERERDAFLAWVRAGFPGGRPDVVLALSLEKHFDIWPVVDAIGARHTYIETNAVKSPDDMKLWPDVQRRGGVHLGQSTDRNLRQLYRIDRGGK